MITMVAAGDDDGHDVDVPFSTGSVVLAGVVYRITVLAGEAVSTIRLLSSQPRPRGAIQRSEFDQTTILAAEAVSRTRLLSSQPMPCRGGSPHSVPVCTL